jgi:hypothetical protein
VAAISSEQKYPLVYPSSSSPSILLSFTIINDFSVASLARVKWNCLGRLLITNYSRALSKSAFLSVRSLLQVIRGMVLYHSNIPTYFQGVRQTPLEVLDSNISSPCFLSLTTIPT